MSEARELLERVAAVARKHSVEMGEGVASMHSVLAADIDIALATQPEPGAVPELPEWLRHEEGDEWCITDVEGYDSYYRLPKHTDDLDRIAEACRTLAARERARRAGS